MQWRPGAWICVRERPELSSDTVSAIYVPDGFDSDELAEHAYNTYGVSFGIGLGEMAGKAFRIGHLGALTEPMALAGLATVEMAMKDLNYPLELGCRRGRRARVLPQWEYRFMKSENSTESSNGDDAALTIPTFDDVQRRAHERIKPYTSIAHTILTSSFLDERTGVSLFFKCENFQKAGAFKVRGASNAVFGLDDAMAEKGVATHSSGNHALSLSYAAGRRGIPCHVVMPRTAPEAKKDAVRGYGGEITECEPSHHVA